MRIAIFSDVHGNLEALTAVLEKIDGFDVSQVICLGDVVGYGADPNACVAQVQAVADRVLAGNHDWAAVGLEDPHFFNPVALSAIRWTADVLHKDHVQFLRSCPLVWDDPDTCYVHASPIMPQAWHYLYGPEDGRTTMKQTDVPVCFVGHSHQAFISSHSGQEDVLGEGTMQIAQAERYLINVGSVGQPRDGDARASFVVWDQENGNLTLHRVSYDISAAQAKIRAAGLPEFLAERIAVGM